MVFDVYFEQKFRNKPQNIYMWAKMYIIYIKIWVNVNEAYPVVGT